MISLVCVNGVVPPELTFAKLVRDVTERPVRLHDLVGYSEVLPPGYAVGRRRRLGRPVVAALRRGDGQTNRR